MADIIQWVATAATICAALVTAANLGTRITGYGFAIFLVGSLAWIVTGVLTDQPALLWTNIALSGLNLFGMWRWLGRQAKVEEGGDTAARASRFTPGEALFPVSLLTRGEVHARGEKIGACVDAMAGASSGAIRYIVVSDGGVAGVGETLRRADWERLSPTDDGVELDCDPAELPEIERDRWPAR